MLRGHAEPCGFDVESGKIRAAKGAAGWPGAWHVHNPLQHPVWAETGNAASAHDTAISQATRSIHRRAIGQAARQRLGKQAPVCQLARAQIKSVNLVLDCIGEQEAAIAGPCHGIGNAICARRQLLDPAIGRDAVNRAASTVDLTR